MSIRVEQRYCCRWSHVIRLALKSLRKRAVRASMTMISVVLSISFLMYVWCSRDIIAALRALNTLETNTLLMQAGIDIQAGAGSGRMQWLVIMSLLVTSVGILNAMLMSVTERFKEIGTMKCIGATNRYVVRLFLVEAGLMGAVGTGVGLLLGFSVALVQHLASFGAPVIASIPWDALLVSGLKALTIGVGLTVVFALYPAHAAATMLPVSALRVEE